MSYDGIVIGGGAAGMMAAITAAKQGGRILLLEKNTTLGKKLRITGKGRCNVTNNCVPEEVLKNTPRNGRFLFSAMTAYPPEKVMAFFEENGCPLKTERGNRVFPQSDNSASVVECLKSALKKYRVEIRQAVARHIVVEGGLAAGVFTDKGFFESTWVILATGGASYPATGSTGDGYTMAAKLGHTVLPPTGSLVPLETEGRDCQEMQGLSLRNIGVKMKDGKGKVIYRDFGELLFTHFGISGPTVLSASAHIKQTPCVFSIDLKPALDEGKLESRILRDLEMYRNRAMENALTDLLPRSMIPVVLRRIGVDAQLQANALKKEQRRALVAVLKDFSLIIRAKRPVEEAIITSGGIKTGEVDPRTMESKLIPGLYFAGEILDCDAYTGGFNLQIAWATGHAAAVAAMGKSGLTKT